MPAYECPKCRRTVIQTVVYKKPKIRCPHCGTIFDPDKAGKPSKPTGDSNNG